MSLTSLFALGACSSGDSAEAPPPDAPRITAPETRATPPGADSAAVYLLIEGSGKADTLVGASTSIADSAEIHESVHEDAVMRMRPVDSVPVPGNGLVAFAPAGLHIMLVGLHEPLVAGTSVPLELQFQNSGPVPVQVVVRPLAQ